MNQIVIVNTENMKGKIPGLFSIDKGWYDISKEGQNIKYIYFPGDMIRSSSIYRKYKDEIEKNLKKYIQIIKTKLDLMDEIEISKKQKQGKITFDFNSLNLKTYDISTIFKGESFTETEVEYREDSSIMFSKENEAYKRIVDMTLFLGNEAAAAILEHRILVIPNYVNDTTTTSWGAYGYHFEKNNITGPLLGKPLIILATVHTHPSGGGPSTWIYDG